MAIMELREQSLKPPAFLTPLPSYKKMLAYLLAFSFATGFALRLNSLPAAEALVFGGAEGIFLLALPAFLASVFCASVLARKEFKQRLKYFLFTGALGTAVTAIAFAVSTYALGINSQATQHAILLANALAYAIWFVALNISLSTGFSRAAVLALTHPLLNLAFLVLWRKLGVLETTFSQASFFFLAPKLAIASVVMLAVLWGVFHLLNAPAKRNFGVSATQAASLFFAQWLQGSKGLEQVFNEMGEDVVTTIGAVAFRRTADGLKRRGGGLKAIFLSPNVHFGPFGNLGGSELPAILSKNVGQKLACEAFVFHGTVYHDFNPVSSSSAAGLERAFVECVKQKKVFSPTAALLSSEAGVAEVNGFAFGKGAFLALSPPPFPSGDFDFASGYALGLKASQKLGEVVLCDRHSASRQMRKWSIGSREFHDFVQAVEKLESPQQKKFSLGVASNSLGQFTHANGVGKAGLKIAVFEIGGKKHCIALFDANNMLPELRNKLVSALRERFRFSYCDVFTTDTHAVNTLDNVHNPLGKNIDWDDLEVFLVEAAQQAIHDLEPCEAKVRTSTFETRVLGSGRAGELASTVNAIVAIARLAAPAVLIISLGLALLALLLV